MHSFSKDKSDQDFKLAYHFKIYRISKTKKGLLFYLYVVKTYSFPPCLWNHFSIQI